MKRSAWSVSGDKGLNLETTSYRSRVFKGCDDVFSRQFVVLVEEFLDSLAGSKQFKNDLHRHRVPRIRGLPWTTVGSTAIRFK